MSEAGRWDRSARNIDLEQILPQEQSEEEAKQNWSDRFSNASSTTQSNINSPHQKPQANQTAAILIDLIQNKDKKYTREIQPKVSDNKSIQLMSVQSAPLVVFRQFFEKLQNERRNLCQEFDNMNEERQNLLKEMDKINREMYELEMKKMQIQHQCSQTDQNQLVLHQQIRRVEHTIKHLHHESNQFEKNLFSKLFSQLQQEPVLPQLGSSTQPSSLSKNKDSYSTSFEELKIGFQEEEDEEEEQYTSRSYTSSTTKSSKKSKKKKQNNSSTHQQFIFQQTTQQSFTFNHVHNCYILSHQQPFSSSSFDTSKETLYAYKSVLDFTILNNKLYAACTDASIKIFDLNREEQGPTETYPNLYFMEWQCNNSKKWIKTITSDPTHHQIMSGGADGFIQIWDAKTVSPKDSNTLDQQDEWFEEDLDEEFWLDEASSLVQQPSLQSKKNSLCTGTIAAHKSSVTDLICLDETRLVSCGVDCTIKSFDRNTLKWITSINSAHQNYVKTIHWSNSHLFSAGGDGNIHQWDLRNNKQVHSLACFLHQPQENQSIHCLVSNDSQIIAGSRSGYLYQFDMRNPSKMVQTIPIGSAIQALYWNPKNSNQLFYAAERSAPMLLDLESQITLQKCNGHQANCSQLLLHNDMLYSSSLDSTIKLWNVL